MVVHIPNIVSYNYSLFFILQDSDIKAILEKAGQTITLTIIPTFIFEHMVKWWDFIFAQSDFCSAILKINVPQTQAHKPWEKDYCCKSNEQYVKAHINSFECCMCCISKTIKNVQWKRLFEAGECLLHLQSTDVACDPRET